MLDVSALRDSLVKLRLTGELNRNNPEAIRQAIRDMLGGKDYYAMGADLARRGLTYHDVIKTVAHDLGVTVDRFESDQPPYIDPEHTVSRLLTAAHRLGEVAEDHGRIMFATAHPGSLFAFYQELARHFEAQGAKLARLTAPVPAPDKRWLDDVGGVIALSDEGNLMHTHSGQGIGALFTKAKPDIIMADHAFAIAAMNADIPTIAIFDVDDAAVPLLASEDPDRFVAVPMNDNQTNTRTAQAAVRLIETLTHAPSLPKPALSGTTRNS